MTPTCAIDGCDRTELHARGMCSLHYNRWQRTGDPGPAAFRPQIPPGDVWLRIDKRGPDDCWLWVGSRDRKGYGRYNKTAAHRVVYGLLVEPVPPELELDHLCRVTSCVNPKHLEPVTRRENLARSTNPNRFAILYNTCMRGHEFTPENTYVAPRKPRTRRCRICMRDAKRRTKEAGQLKRTA